ncbi:uncharacterized protein At5g23160-like [Rhodamnia argentea]|uniref:Uncharacterized protein At5g23160-like n=1 Tax=Rhodamnia argentea TaxID=178133 RepID=A0A8B8QXG4_9MYRT|nr:uncharacterized protein At5g23160-like [Rhodamnia argentea]
MMVDSPPKAKKRPSPAMSRSNSASTKFFRCFKPAVVDDGDGGDEGKRVSDEPLLSQVAAEENDGRALQKIRPADKGDDGSDDRAKKKKKKKGLKLFSRASMAVFFEASLAKKMQKRKSTKNSHESINSLSTEADRILKLMHQNSGSGVSDNDNVQTTESDASTSSRSSVATTFSPSLGSSRSSSTNSSLRGTTKSSIPSGSFNSKQIQSSALEDSKERRPSSSDNSAVCLLLLTLLVLVLWGKVCAIICTSTWLLFVPRWSTTKCTKPSSEENGGDYSNMDSAEYKKKIILEGLLQRKRSLGTARS